MIADISTSARKIFRIFLPFVEVVFLSIQYRCWCQACTEASDYFTYGLFMRISHFFHEIFGKLRKTPKHSSSGTTTGPDSDFLADLFNFYFQIHSLISQIGGDSHGL